MDNDRTIWTNPNGNPKHSASETSFYTQERKFYDAEKNYYNSMATDYYLKDPIARDAESYSNWAEMHMDVWWFDTAGCHKGSFIGEANSVVISPDNSVNKQYATDPTNTPQQSTPTSTASPSANFPGESGAAFSTFRGGWYIGANYNDRVAPS